MAVLAVPAFASGGSTIAPSECTANPPATLSASQCEMSGTEAKCTLSRP
ncbi:MAG: hypothetical protein AB1730_18155 [Myxococcota bacterium]